VEELARTAVRLLAGQVNGETSASVTILPPTLKIRDTTAPAPARAPDRS
jgi:DNA-binding LacI/PurR family transcriptional regulator